MNNSDEIRLIYGDKEKFIEQRLTEIRKNLSEKLDKLPKEELPFMEPHLRALYFETYFLLAEGFYNSSLVLCGILLEALIKEKLFMTGISDEELENSDFRKVIQKAKNTKILTDDELTFLDTKREKLRNPYAHYNKMKLSKGIYFPTWKIPSEGFVPKLIELDGRVKRGELTEVQARQELIKGSRPELMSSKEMRVIAHLAKSEMEKNVALPLFLEIDKFVREFAEKYFKP
jgi:hypothetical protein